jgi:hypothetical protein
MSGRPTVQYGDQNEDVQVLQSMLMQFRYEAGMSGQFDDQTLDAVNKFQVDHHMDMTGSCDEAMWHKLEQGLGLAPSDAEVEAEANAPVATPVHLPIGDTIHLNDMGDLTFWCGPHDRAVAKGSQHYKVTIFDQTGSQKQTMESTFPSGHDTPADQQAEVQADNIPGKLPQGEYWLRVEVNAGDANVSYKDFEIVADAQYKVQVKT